MITSIFILIIISFSLFLLLAIVSGQRKTKVGKLWIYNCKYNWSVTF